RNVEDGGEVWRGAVVEVGSGGGDTAEGGRINAGERAAEPVARAGFDSADVVELAADAVGEVGAAVATETLQIEEMLAAVLAGDGRAAIGLPGVALGIFVQGSHVRSQRVQIGAQAGFG